MLQYSFAFRVITVIPTGTCPKRPFPICFERFGNSVNEEKISGIHDCIGSSFAWHVFVLVNQRTPPVLACHVIYILSIYAELLCPIRSIDFI